MQDLNAVAIIGRLTKDLGDGFQVIGNGTPKAAFSIAVNRTVKHGNEWGDEVNYFDVELLGKQAESLKPFLIKGKQLAVYGALVQNRWEKDGQKHSRIVIKAENVQLLGGKKEGAESGETFTPKTNAVPHQEADFIQENIPF